MRGAQHPLGLLHHLVECRHLIRDFEGMQMMIEQIGRGGMARERFRGAPGFR
jgi:hypothetical protein